MDDEMVDLVDEHGATKGQLLKTEAHKTGALHKTVIGYLRYGEDWALVRQAGHKQDAAQLVAPVGGHVAAGESEIEGLLRECEEEIGTLNITYELVGRKVFHREVIGRDENHLFVVFEITTNDDIVLNDESVSIDRFTPTELKQALKDKPEDFGDAYYFVLETFYPDYLPASYTFRYKLS